MNMVKHRSETGRTPRKLTLKRETIIRLSEKDLREVAGADYNGTNGQSNCRACSTTLTLEI
jgi:hypothetical protein